MDQNDRLRELPAVHEVLERLFPALARFPRALVAAETRRAVDELRAEILGGGATGPPVEARVEQAKDRAYWAPLKAEFEAFRRAEHEVG